MNGIDILVVFFLRRTDKGVMAERRLYLITYLLSSVTRETHGDKAKYVIFIFGKNYFEI